MSTELGFLMISSTIESEQQEFLISAILEWKLDWLKLNQNDTPSNMTLGQLLQDEDRDQLIYLASFLEEAFPKDGEESADPEQILQLCSDFLATAQGFDERLESVAPHQVFDWFQETLKPSFLEYQSQSKAFSSQMQPDQNTSNGTTNNDARELLKKVLKESPDRPTGNSSDHQIKEEPLKTSADIKNRIIHQYSLVTLDEDERTHRPHLPKQESKPLTRYLNDRVVSTRGDRYIIEKKDSEDSKEEEERLKSTFVNIRPLRKYRFH